MKEKAVCLLVLGVALIAVTKGVNHKTLTATRSAYVLVADGGSPIPPPIPMGAHQADAAAPTYADGGSPIPPPIPMGAGTSKGTEPTYVADGGSPIPPPIPMFAPAFSA